MTPFEVFKNSGRFGKRYNATIDMFLFGCLGMSRRAGLGSDLARVSCKSKKKDMMARNPWHIYMRPIPWRHF